MHTSSPTWPITAWPASSMPPRARPGSGLHLAGVHRQSGQLPPTNALARSVPPQIGPARSRLPSSCSHAYPSGGSGEPVEPTSAGRQVARSPRTRCRPSGRPYVDAAPLPKNVMPAWSANVHSASISGCPGCRRTSTRRADQQAAEQAVPHDPAGGGVPVKPVPGAEVVVQCGQLEVLQHYAAVPVNDRLGQPGRA